MLSRDIEKLLADIRGNIWIATRGGLSKYIISSGRFKNFVATPGQSGLMIDDLLDLCIENDNLWIATENGGLSQFDLRSETFTNYSYDKFDPYSIVNNSIWALHTDKQNRVWVGSYAKGICVYDRLDSKFQALRFADSVRFDQCLY
ncbi:MAG: two-component regulator propeller domain-containing protein [Cyclobacteriaceae bacterium]|nr:two-component regulator propeller domain-containing protein [Cyclobacteriaceae bacterium]